MPSKNPTTSAPSYKVGDMVFFRIHDSGGEGMFIGRLKAHPDVLVLLVGKLFVEHDAECCSKMQGGYPAEGESWRRKYLKENLGALQ
jgi:hypothetical protein